MQFCIATCQFIQTATRFFCHIGTYRKLFILSSLHLCRQCKSLLKVTGKSDLRFQEHSKNSKKLIFKFFKNIFFNVQSDLTLVDFNLAYHAHDIPKIIGKKPTLNQ